MPTPLTLTLSDNLNSPGLKDQAGFRGSVLSQLPVQVVQTGKPNDRLSQLPVQVVRQTYTEFDLRDLLNFWQDSVSKSVTGPISIALSDNMNAPGWQDSVIEQFPQQQLVLTDNLNSPWKDLVQQGFPAQTLVLSDSMNFWQDQAGYRGRVLSQLPVQTAYKHTPNVRLSQLVIQVLRPTNIGQQPRISIMT